MMSGLRMKWSPSLCLRDAIVAIAAVCSACGCGGASPSDHAQQQQQQQQQQQCDVELLQNDDYAAAAEHLEQRATAMGDCATLLFESPDVSRHAFFAERFGQQWVHLRDWPDSKRANVCSGVFQRSVVPLLLRTANAEYIAKHIHFALASEDTVLKCQSRQDCLDLHSRGDSTVVIGAIEQFRPAASLLAAELKRKLGLWVHLNVYFTPKGEHHGFGLHTDQTDGLIVQLEGNKQWEVCGFVAPDIGDTKNGGVVQNSADPYLSRNCTQLVLRAGDALYLPAGQVHMARSTPDVDSLHVTIGVQRGAASTGFSSQTWSRLIEATALSVSLDPPYATLAMHPRLHRIPRALAQDTAHPAAPTTSGYHGALKRAAFEEDVPW